MNYPDYLYSSSSSLFKIN